MVESPGDSVSCSPVRVSLLELRVPSLRLTLPGANLREPDANGANLTSTLRRAFALKGAEGGVGLGPYLFRPGISTEARQTFVRTSSHRADHLGPASLDVCGPRGLPNEASLEDWRSASTCELSCCRLRGPEVPKMAARTDWSDLPERPAVLASHSGA
mgnify:CR=1 FL=1